MIDLGRLVATEVDLGRPPGSAANLVYFPPLHIQNHETGKKNMLRICRGEELSHRNYVESFHKSLRFGTTESRANVGTSIMGPKPQKPLVEPIKDLAGKALKQANLTLNRTRDHDVDHDELDETSEH